LRTEELGEKEGTTGVWKDGEGIRDDDRRQGWRGRRRGGKF
jgi:hypothetical protein